jgi:hypothetical protein
MALCRHKPPGATTQIIVAHPLLLCNLGVQTGVDTHPQRPCHQSPPPTTPLPPKPQSGFPGSNHCVNNPAPPSRTHLQRPCRLSPPPTAVCCLPPHPNPSHLSLHSLVASNPWLLLTPQLSLVPTTVSLPPPLLLDPPAKALPPVATSHSSMPKAYTSLALLQRPCINISGAMCVRVPCVEQQQQQQQQQQ